MTARKYNGVFEGGGVKGIALIGALKRVEEEGIEFSKVAGTSAGAIAAALVSAGYKAEEIKDILWNKNFSDFANISIFKGKGLWGILRIFPHLLSLFFSSTGYGVFSTDKFYRWIKALLKEKGVTSFKSAPSYLRVFAVDILKQELLQFD